MNSISASHDTSAIVPTLIVGDTLAARPDLPGVRVVALADWIAGLAQVSAADAPLDLAAVDDAVLGFLLGADDVAALAANVPVRRLIDTLQAPTELCDPHEDASALTRRAFGLALDQMNSAQRDAAQERAAAATIRQQHMAMQDRFVEFEEFVFHSLAPKYVRTAEFRDQSATVTLTEVGPTLRQPLPFSTASLAAIDVHVRAQTGRDAALLLRLTRRTGPAFAPEIRLVPPPNHTGWVRFSLTHALSGPVEDVIAELRLEGAGSVTLSLSHPSPVPDYRLRAGSQVFDAPLALRGYRSLPGAALPPTQMPDIAPPPDGQTRLLMAHDLQPATLLPHLGPLRGVVEYGDYVTCEFWPRHNAFFVHPSAERPVVAVVRDIAASALTRLRASIQVARHDALPVAFAIGAAPAGLVTTLKQCLRHLGPWTVLSPAEWGECRAQLAAPVTGRFDLFLAASMEGRPHNSHGWALFRDILATNGPVRA